MSGPTDSRYDDREPPRSEVDLYGEPVAAKQSANHYYEVYADRHAEAPEDVQHVFVAKHTLEAGEWVKQGLDRHRIGNLFNENEWPTD